MITVVGTCTIIQNYFRQASFPAAFQLLPRQLPGQWLLSRWPPPDHRSLALWQSKSNKTSPGNAFCLLALSTAIQNASPMTYQLAQVWKGEFYRFKDVEYITNDYPLKPPIFLHFLNFKSLDLKYKINFFTSLTNNSIPFSSDFSEFKFYFQFFNATGVYFTVRFRSNYASLEYFISLK